MDQQQLVLEGGAASAIKSCYVQRCVSWTWHIDVMSGSDKKGRKEEEQLKGTEAARGDKVKGEFHVKRH